MKKINGKGGKNKGSNSKNKSAKILFLKEKLKNLQHHRITLKKIAEAEAQVLRKIMGKSSTLCMTLSQVKLTTPAKEEWGVVA